MNAGSFTNMVDIGRDALGHSEDDLVGTLAGLADKQMVSWVRGVLERIRVQGGINHPWLQAYLDHDGARWHLWGKLCLPRVAQLVIDVSSRLFPAAPQVQAFELRGVSFCSHEYMRIMNGGCGGGRHH